MSDTDAVVRVDHPAEGIARIALHKPEKRNAFDPAMRAAVAAVFERVLGDDAVKVIIFTGSGGVFSAGGDVASMGTETELTGSRRMAGNHAFCRMLYRSDKPIIAAVEGFCVGAGAGLALLSDVIIAGEGAAIGFPFVKLGLAPDYGIAFTLPQRAGIGVAKMLAFTGRIVKAGEARALGLFDQVVPDSDVQAAALALAEEMRAQSAHGIALTKRLFQNAPISFESSLDLERTAQTLGMVSADHKEGVAAFKEKRKPRFS
ncbi:MAG: hypothetical protein GC199_08575 [Alphaproteobacteria bacterium]|nr:hypothetical protein [Alphaproteobacteria bacterium]